MRVMPPSPLTDRSSPLIVTTLTSKPEISGLWAPTPMGRDRGCFVIPRGPNSLTERRCGLRMVNVFTTCGPSKMTFPSRAVICTGSMLRPRFPQKLQLGMSVGPQMEESFSLCRSRGVEQIIGIFGKSKPTLRRGDSWAKRDVSLIFQAITGWQPGS
jgi:hypothetical protein